MKARQMGSAGRQEAMGFTDKGGSGGYESENLDEGMARSLATSAEWANDSAANVQRKTQPNHVGGPRAST
jgi:hypothetical protein